MVEKVNCSTLKKMIERLEKTSKASNDKLDMLHSEIKGLHEKLASQAEVNNELKRSLIYMGQELEDIKNENKLMKKELKVVNLSNEKLTKKVMEIEVKEKSQHFELNKIQNWLQGSNIELHGIPVVDTNENVESIALSVLKKIDPKVERGQIGTIRRMKPVKAETNQEKKDGKRIFNPILIAFKSRDMKDKIMKEKRKLANASFSNLNASMVFVNENLTTSSRILLGHARRFRKENNWKYAWVKNGIIRIRKSDDSPVIILECIEDLSKVSK